MSSRILQIYYKDNQRSGLLFEPYHNPLRPGDRQYLALESDVMRRAASEGMHNGFRMFGVLSPAFVNKYREMGRSKFFWTRSHRFSKTELETYLDITGADIVSLMRAGQHDFVHVAQIFHPGFFSAWNRLSQLMGIQRSSWRSSDVIYCNYFLAGPQIWDDFGHWLNVAIDYCMNDEELHAMVMADSRYQKPFPEDLRDAYGISYWPLLPFVLERLISAYVVCRKPKVNYF